MKSKRVFSILCCIGGIFLVNTIHPPPVSAFVFGEKGIADFSICLVLAIACVVLVAAVIILLNIRHKLKQTVRHSNRDVQDQLAEQRFTEKKLRRNERQLQSLIDNIPGVVYRCGYDTGKTIYFISDTIEEITGYEASEFTDSGRTFKSIIHPDDRETFESKIEASMDNPKPYAIEYRIICKNGSIRWVSERGQCVFSETDDSRWRDGIIFDITAKKLSEKNLKQLAHELSLKNNALKNNNQELDDFVNMVSHDLRSPLVGIRGYTEILKKQYAEIFDDDGTMYLNRIITASQKMTGLIEDLLKLSRVSRLKKQFELTDISHLLQSIYEDLKYQIEEHNVEFSIGAAMPEITCSGLKLKEVFVNLINNAIKYSSKKNAKPKVGVGYEERDGDYLFYVRDNGIGISKEYHDRIFEPFERLHSSSEYSGSGIGLKIVKQVIDEHGGRIWVQSKEGSGATFYFTIPKQLPDQPQSEIQDEIDNIIALSG